MTTKAQIEQRVAELAAMQPWNHNLTLPHGVQTRPGEQRSHGKNLVKWERIRPLLEAIGIEGRRVLDLGCNEGFFSCALADLGAQVTGIDVDAHRIEKAQFVRGVLEKTRVEFRTVDIYGPDFEALPRFDLCLCMGFLHRVPDPYTAMARLASKADLVLFEWKALKHGPHDQTYAWFSPKPIDTADYYGTEYWLLSYATVETILQRLGFTHFHRVDDPRQRRALLVAGRVDNPVFHRPEVRLHRGRVRALLAHTKRYLLTVLGVLSGRINA